MIRMKSNPPDIMNPNRTFCSMEGCENLQRNSGHKKWGKFCGKHHRTPEQTQIRKEKARIKSSEKRQLNKRKRMFEVELRAKRPRLCNICDTVKPCTEYRGILGRVCATCKSAQYRSRALKKTYGISETQYQSMLLSQGGVCAICGNPPNGKHLCVDHDHTTGQIRGLLCDRCNFGIGYLMDDLDIIASAASYLVNAKVGMVS